MGMFLWDHWRCCCLNREMCSASSLPCPSLRHSFLHLILNRIFHITFAFLPFLQALSKFATFCFLSLNSSASLCQAKRHHADSQQTPYQDEKAKEQEIHEIHPVLADGRKMSKNCQIDTISNSIIYAQRQFPRAVLCGMLRYHPGRSS